MGIECSLYYDPKYTEEVNRKKIRGTIALIKHARKVRASKLPEDTQFEIEWGYYVTIGQYRLMWNRQFHNAINLKSGLMSQKEIDDYQDEYIRMIRDQRNLHSILRIRLRVYQFETKEVRKRYSHLLADRSDDY